MREFWKSLWQHYEMWPGGRARNMMAKKHPGRSRSCQRCGFSDYDNNEMTVRGQVVSLTLIVILYVGGLYLLKWVA